MKRNVQYLTEAAVIAAAYIVLTLPFAQFAFGMIQFRLAEALTVLAALTPAAIPGLFIGCLLTNTLYPSGLGIIDIIFGSLATLIAAFTTWRLHLRFSGRSLEKSAHAQGSDLKAVVNWRLWTERIVVLLPAAVVNALVVGFYLPFLIPDTVVTPWVVLGFMLSIFVSECVVIYLIGLPLLLTMKKTRLGARSHARKAD